MQHLIDQILKFGVVGIIAFAIDFTVMVTLTEALAIDPVASATISFIVSVAFNYLASMRFVFSHRDDIGRGREAVLFLILSAIGLAINDAVIWLLTAPAALDYRLAKVIATALVMIWNFSSRKATLDGGEPARRP